MRRSSLCSFLFKLNGIKCAVGKGKFMVFVSLVKRSGQVNQRTLLRAGSFLALVLQCFPAFAALERVGDFALLDASGEFHQLSRYKHRSALALMTFDARCSEQRNIEQFAALRERYEEAGISFALLDTAGMKREQLLAQATNFSVSLPLLEDGPQLIGELLGARSNDEIILLNPERLNIFFRGTSVDEFSTLLDNLSTSPPANTVIGAANGCALDRPLAKAVPDYTQEVAPIILDNCVECHRRGGVGPFAMDSYLMLLGWSPMIREVVLNKRMPPAQVDPYYGHSKMARYLNDREIKVLVSWIDARGPRGEGSVDPLEEFDKAQGGSTFVWQLGEPDLIIDSPSHSIPSTGVMDYLYEDVPLSFDEDRWLRAIETRPGDESVLHHLMIFVTAPDEHFWGTEREQEITSRRFVEGYAPGPHRAVEFESGTGVLIPKGHKLSLQFHYVTNGQSTVDNTSLGLYFAPMKASLAERRTLAVSTRFVLPPNTPDFPLVAETEIQEDIVVTGVRARMSYRGKKMRFVVEDTDSNKTTLFSIPAYNYGWQPHYLLDEPIAVAAGSILRVEGALDNSVSNPTNPDPDLEIPWGLESWEEMFTGYFTYYPQSSGELLDPRVDTE